MKDTILTILFLLALFIVLPVFVLLVRDRIFHPARKRTPQQLQAQRQAYRERLVNPQQTLVEAELGALLPQRLIAMYSDVELVLGTDLNICPPGKDPKNSSSWIYNFLPLDVESQEIYL
jgi:hypothetical protein